MDENKEILETAEVSAKNDKTQEPKEDKKLKKAKKAKKSKLKNQLLLKRGGYSLAITALFLVALIMVNVLVTALSDRFNLEFDLSADKVSTFDKDNIKYIKDVKQDVKVTVCASEENYAPYMLNYIQKSHSVTGDFTSYYNQTLKLIKKYNDYNKKISVEFVDMYNDPKFDAIQQKYANEGLIYGDIIVTTTANVDGKDVERFKIIKYTDIYDLMKDNNNGYYGMMGYETQGVAGNNIETALTSAIAYVLGTDTKKVAIITGHSSADMENYAKTYAKLLTDNSFEVEIISTAPIGKLSDDTDVIVLMAPVNDFLADEINTMVNFLDNDGKYGKGLIYFGSAACPVLPNLNDLLADWGIETADGKLFMTDEKYCIAGDPFTINTPINLGTSFITSGNQPLIADEGENKEYTVSTIKTPKNVVIAPTSAGKDWTGYSKDDVAEYPIIAQSVKKTYNKDNKEVSSMVLAFSSLDFITSQLAEQQSVYNKNMTLALSNAAVQAEDTGIEFVSKQIKNESFSGKVTAGSSNTVRIVFMVSLPLVMIALGIFIFIRRKNA